MTREKIRQDLRAALNAADSHQHIMAFSYLVNAISVIADEVYSDKPSPPDWPMRIPPEILKAASDVELWFKENNVKEWKLRGIQSRKDD